MEFRSVCTQPLETTFAPIAFELGLFVQIKELESYLETCPFFETEGRNYQELRKKYSKKNLSEKEIERIKEFSKDLIEISKAGLIEREYGEEEYLLIKKEID